MIPTPDPQRHPNRAVKALHLAPEARSQVSGATVAGDPRQSPGRRRRAPLQVFLIFRYSRAKSTLNFSILSIDITRVMWQLSGRGSSALSDCLNNEQPNGCQAERDHTVEGISIAGSGYKDGKET